MEERKEVLEEGIEPMEVTEDVGDDMGLAAMARIAATEDEEEISDDLDGSSLVIQLSNPYDFEGETIEVIDLSGIEDLRTKDIRKIDKIFTRMGYNPALCGITLEYAMLVAHKVSELPLEFLDNLKAKDTMQVKAKVMAFLFVEG